jgi:hypothetical protein
MTTGGYLFLAIAWGLVLWLVIFSMARFLRRKKG